MSGSSFVRNGNQNPPLSAPGTADDTEGVPRTPDGWRAYTAAESPVEELGMDPVSVIGPPSGLPRPGL